MNIQALNGEIKDFIADFVVLPVFLGGQTRKFITFDRLLKGSLSAEIEETEFKGNTGEILIVPAIAGIKSKKIILLGLGDKKQYSAEVLRRSAAGLFKAGNKISGKIAFDLGEASWTIGLEKSVQSLAEAALLAKYEFSKYKEKIVSKKKNKDAELIFLLDEKRNLRFAEAGIKTGKLLGEAALYARDLVNEPASICVPSHLVEHARQIAA